MTKTMLRIIGTSATILGLGANLVSGWVADKQMDNKITEKVAEALANAKKTK